MPGPEIRTAVGEDLPAVQAIYSHETLHGYSTFETRVRPLEQWAAKLASGEEFLVAVEQGRVLGFGYATPFRPRAAYHLTRETSVYVEASARGRGVGTGLYGVLLDRLAGHGFHTALALIALPNPASVRLHQRAGFTLTGTMREVGDKLDRMIDVATYQVMLSGRLS